MEIITEKEFDQKTKSGIVLVDFFATWCMPCRMFGQMLEENIDRFDGVKIYKVDVDENEGLAKRFGILSIPTIILFKDGTQLEKHVGIWDIDELCEVIKSYKN